MLLDPRTKGVRGPGMRRNPGQQSLEFQRHTMNTLHGGKAVLRKFKHTGTLPSFSVYIVSSGDQSQPTLGSLMFRMQVCCDALKPDVQIVLQWEGLYVSCSMHTSQR